jgi:hypothetical protein
MIPTKETINGNDYNFQIQVEKFESEYLFEINSQHIATNGRSAITNSNFLISELIQPILNINVDETVLSLDKKQSERLFKKTISLFKNKSWLKALEENLDEDRNIGGWNASLNF